MLMWVLQTHCLQSCLNFTFILVWMCHRAINKGDESPCCWESCGQTVMYQTLTVWFPELSASDCGHACWLVALPKRFMGHKCGGESPRETQGYERLWPGFFPAIKWELAPRSFSFHTVSHISSVSQRSVILLMVSWSWMIHFFQET